MTPEAAKAIAQEILDAHAQVNASYIANGIVAKAAGLADIIVDLATQLEQAQAELLMIKATFRGSFIAAQEPTWTAESDDGRGPEARREAGE